MIKSLDFPYRNHLSPKYISFAFGKGLCYNKDMVKMMFFMMFAVVGLCAASVTEGESISEIKDSILSAMRITPTAGAIEQSRQELLSLLGDTLLVQTTPSVEIMTTGEFDPELGVVVAGMLLEHNDDLLKHHNLWLRADALEKLQKIKEGRGDASCNFFSLISGALVDGIEYEEGASFANNRLILTKNPQAGCRIFVQRTGAESSEIADQIVLRAKAEGDFVLKSSMLLCRGGVDFNGSSFIDYMYFVMQVFREECFHDCLQSGLPIILLDAFQQAHCDQASRAGGSTHELDVWPFVKDVISSCQPLPSIKTAIFMKNHYVKYENTKKEWKVYHLMQKYILLFEEARKHRQSEVATIHLDLAKACRAAELPEETVDRLLSVAADVALCFECAHYHKLPNSLYLKESTVVNSIIQKLYSGVR